MSDAQVSDLHAASARLVALVDEPGSLNDYAVAVDAVRDALAAEDAAGGPVATPPADPVPAPVEEPAPAAVLTTADGAAASVPAENPPAEVPAPDAHDQAVAAVTAAIAATPTADDPAAHLAALRSDIDAALAEFPDSPQLQDAKAQADALGA